MNREITVPVRALAASMFVLFASQASAEIAGGGVTGGSSGGSFAEIAPPPQAGPDTFQAPDLFAFNEVQDLLLIEPLPLSGGQVLGAGSIVSSHYVAFDPAGPSSLAGFVDFDEPILGLIGGPAGLDATNGLLGAPGVLYGGAPAIGPDMNDQASIAPGMPNRLLVQYGAASPGDHLRVITGTPVPEPTLLMLGGVAITSAVLMRQP